jgi:hypothetical protein
MDIVLAVRLTARGEDLDVESLQRSVPTDGHADDMWNIWSW